GVTHLVASEAALATALVARAARVDLAARVGIGASMTVARLAAEHGDGTEVVSAGVERGFLARLPLACLAPAPDIAATLQRWGIHRLGDLARLPVAEVATRLGPAGAALIRAARGEDERPLAPEPLPAAVEEAVALEYALDSLEPLLFVLRGLVERAVARLGLAGIGCARVALALGRRPDGALRAPTRGAAGPPAGGQRVPAGRPRAQAAASGGGVHRARRAGLRTRRGSRRARGRRGRAVAGRRRMVERGRGGARLLRPGAHRRRRLPLLPRARRPAAARGAPRITRGARSAERVIGPLVSRCR